MDTDAPRTRRPLLTLVLVGCLAVLLVRGVTASWYDVTPNSHAPATLVVNGTDVTHAMFFSGLDVARDTIALRTSAQGLLNPLNVATSHSTSGATQGFPLTLWLALASLACIILAARKKSLLASVLGLFCAGAALQEFSVFSQWSRSPHFFYCTVTPLGGLSSYELALWCTLAFSFTQGLSLALSRLSTLGATYNAAIHSGDHATLGASAFDRLGRAASAFLRDPAGDNPS